MEQASGKPRQSIAGLINISFGFLGIQIGFALQNANMSRIFQTLGAAMDDLPALWVAAPLTGLLVQPIIGALSDRTLSRYGRRTPYFLVGAVLCSLALFAMPHSSSIWMAASLLWILDAANNVTMEPYRAYVSDRLNRDQHSLGFLTQSAFTGLAQTMAYLAPSILVFIGMNKDAVNANNIPHITVAAFLIGALLSFTTVYWSVKTVPELPMSEAEKDELRAKPHGVSATLREIVDAFKDMPSTMRQLWWMKLFQWYAMMCYWIYIVPALALTMFGTRDPASVGFRDAGLLNGQIGGFYNFIAFIAAFAMVPFTKRLGAKPVHAVCLTLAGIGMWAIPSIQSKALLFLPMIGVGLAWGSIMGNPYVLLAGSIPPER
ncbi:MAG: SLC45 family MFS transporter, partial [Nitrospira sp.]|nr:SLC45 family MFS transporter [Nitrospira sp.]